MKIILLGHGKTGKAVANAAAAQGHEIVSIVTSTSPLPKVKADVAIDFTASSATVKHADWATALNLPLVIGTTGWDHARSEVEALVTQRKGLLLHAPNFAIGVQIFLKLVANATQLLDKFPYDIAGVELHHNQKADSPSGTAKATAQQILDHSSHKKKVVYDLLDTAPQHDELHFASVRCGTIPGTHQVMFDSPSDSITLTHNSKGREGFAHGAIAGAQWLLKQPQGVYTINDMIRNLLETP